MTVATKSYTVKARTGVVTHAVTEFGRNAESATSACGRVFASEWGDFIRAAPVPRLLVTCRTCIRAVGW